MKVLKGTLVWKFCTTILDPLSRHISKNLRFRPQTSAQIFENVPLRILTISLTHIEEIVYQYKRNHLLVLTKSFTSIDEIIYWYWQNRQNRIMVLTKSFTGIGEIVYWSLAMHTYKLCISLLSKFWNHLLILMKS